MNELVVKENNDGFLIINTLEQALQVAEIIAKSSFCPKAFQGKTGDVLVCMQFGKEIGLKPLQALQNIAVINGKPSIWGDAMLALCQQHPSYEYVAEEYDAATMTATCRAKRKGQPEVVGRFSKAQAEKAGLWGKNVWASYPDRMLAMRARGFALRDTWADALKGLISAEEAQDYHKKEHNKPSGNVFEAIANKQTEAIETEEYISPGELAALNDKIDLAKADVVAMCNHLKIESLDFVPKSKYAKLMAQLDKKIMTNSAAPTGELVAAQMRQAEVEVAVNPEVQAFFED